MITKLKSLGLGGDGDEVDAIENAFAVFNVEVPVEDACHWVRVGDVYSSLARELERSGDFGSPCWDKFCVAISEETGCAPELVEFETKLLAEPLIHVTKDWLKKLVAR